MNLSVDNRNTFGNGSIRIIEQYNGCLKKTDYMTGKNANKLLRTVTNAFAPVPSKEPKYLVKGQAQMLNKCIDYVTKHWLNMDYDSVIWIKNLGNNVFEYMQEGVMKSTKIKLNLNA